MITRKCFALDHNLVPVLCWSIEARHEQMQVRGKRLHGCHFTLQGSNDRGQLFGNLLVDVKERREVRIFVALEVAKDALCSPCREVLLDAIIEVTGL